MDVETAFLNGELEEEVQPEGHEEAGKEAKVCRLHKSIYGMKQSPRCWNQVLDDALKGMKFTPTQVDPCVYVAPSSVGRLFLAVYVDDLLLAGKVASEIATTKEHLTQQFRMESYTISSV